MERPDVAEATAKAMKGGKVSSLASNRQADHKERRKSRDVDSSTEGYSGHSLAEDLSPMIEKPLPEDSAVRHEAEGKAPTESNYVESTTVTAKGKVPQRASKQRSSAAHSESNQKVGRNTVRTEVEGHDDNYSTLRKELQDMTKQLGPEEPVITSEELRREEDGSLNHNEEQSQHETGRHSAVTEGIEQAILGLTNVYNVLRNSGSLENSLANRGKSNASANADTPNVVEGGEANSTSLPDVDITAENSTQLTNRTDSRSGAESEAGDTFDVGNKPASGISLIALVAGFVVVGTVALLVTGYVRNRHEMQARHAPLYPPRGPSFV